MFWTTGKSTGRKPRRRARDGHQFSTSSEKRRRRKMSGLSGKQQRKVTNQRRRYRKGL